MKLIIYLIIFLLEETMNKQQKKRSKTVHQTLQKSWANKYWQFILDNHNKECDWFWISSNPNITMDIIIDNPEKPWDWFWLSRNPKLTMNIIKLNPCEPWKWDWRTISNNPNITMEDICDNPDKPWDWYNVSSNPFHKAKNEFTSKEFHKHLMAYRIQHRWKNAIVNPYCRLGINTIERDMEFAGL